jgi:electron transport complex protein RnfB
MITVSVLTLFALGFVSAGLLAVASKVLYVEEDPRIEVVTDALPGANCGGCGFAGCEAYAIAVLNDPDMPPDKCCAAGPEVSIRVAELTGKAAGDADPQVMFRRCLKMEGNVAKKYDYAGVMTCASAKLLDGGPNACSYSCMGFGDCVRACPFGAMWLEDGMVRISPSKCTGCGNCAKACPNGILELVSRRARVMIFCSTQDKGKAVRDACELGCISCGVCIKQCPAQCISEEGNRIVIDHKACLDYGPSCGEICVEKCPRKILRCLSPEQIAEAPETEPVVFPEKAHVTDLNA